MALSKARLAQAIEGFLADSKEEFEKSLYEMYQTVVLISFYGETEDRKRVTFAVAMLAQDGSRSSEQDYALHIETIGSG